MIELYYVKCVLPSVQQAARQCGYAIGVHGSLKRDFDLIAVPWSESSKSVEELVEAVRASVSGEITESGTKGGRWDPEQQKFVEAIIMQPEVKPHGRLAWSIQLGAGAYIDLSVMPRQTCANRVEDEPST